jgi:hypothetical protein
VFGGLRKGGGSRTSPTFGGGEGAVRYDFEGGWRGGQFLGRGEGAVVGARVLPDEVLGRGRRHRAAILGRRARWCRGGERRGGM